jgi:hypothetical protein
VKIYNMKVRNLFLLFLFFIGVVGSCQMARTADEPKATDSRVLFSGRNLDGWYTYLDGKGKNSDPDKVFQVYDGLIHIYKDAADGTLMPSSG